MINLLPFEEKNKLLSEKRAKLAVILVFSVLVSLISMALILLSIKFYILAETDYQKKMLEQIRKENQTADFVTFSGIIKKYNAILSQIDSFYKKEIYFSQALNIIAGFQMPQDLSLTNFSLTRDDSGKISVNVSGKSLTRNSLLLFKKNIEQDPKIKNSYFSPESWVNPKNINFSLSFEIKKDENQQ